jgi:ubiquinone/menaquinone biosynthesis C-methylase UbiE
MSAKSYDPLATFYDVIWPGDESADPRFALFERDMGGRAIEEVFYELASEAGIGKDSVVLDVGCGQGRQATEIARRLSCSVVAIDPLEHCLRLARERALREGVSHKVEFRRGHLEHLPVDDDEVDLIWCLDSFNHATDIPRGLREFARVLAPNGLIFNCSALAAPGLEPREKEWLCRTLSLNPETMCARSVEHLLAASGLRVVLAGSTTDAGSKFFEAIGKSDFRHIEKLAHMVRDERRFIDAFGDAGSQILRAHAMWNVYLLIGKITYHVWVMRLDPGVGARRV